MRMNCILAAAAVLVLSPGIMSVPAAAADDSIEPAVDQICGAIENVCSQTCYSNDPRGEYPALTANCIDHCDAEYDECVGDWAAPARGAGAGGIPSGGAVLDAGPRKPRPTAPTAGQTGVGNAASGDAVLDSGGRKPATGESQGVQPYGTIRRFQFQQQ